MKVLTLKWDCFGYKHIRRAFERKGFTLCEVDFPRDKEDGATSEKLAAIVVEAIEKNKADVLFSFNFFPVAAMAAAACRIKYISWTYDSPYMFLYSKTIDFPTNYAFVFDKNEYFNLKRLGVANVYYMPMAADTDYFDSIVLDERERAHYKADVAMIGSMYTEARHNLMRHFEGLDDYTNGYIEGLMDAQRVLYGVSILEKGLTEDIIKNILKVCPMYARGDSYASQQWLLANYFIARKLTSLERIDLLSGLSNSFNVTLYTPEKTPNLPKVKNMGSVEYYKDFPKAVKGAKINLNITLRSIVSGMPLRAFDIMGCGGFLLTNYQADFEDYFIADEDYVYFESQKDLEDKVGYYLAHDNERMDIASRGYRKVKEEHNFDIRLESMLEIAGLL